MGVKFGWYYKMAYLCTALKQNAEIAQLVEHNLAKVRVASSSLVFRSSLCILLKMNRRCFVMNDAPSFFLFPVTGVYGARFEPLLIPFSR